MGHDWHGVDHVGAVLAVLLSLSLWSCGRSYTRSLVVTAGEARSGLCSSISASVWRGKSITSACAYELYRSDSISVTSPFDLLINLPDSRLRPHRFVPPHCASLPMPRKVSPVNPACLTWQP